MRRATRPLELALKRGADALIAVATLAALFPLLAVLWIWIRMQMGSPAVFRQLRGGLHGKTFVFYKFRTMTSARDPVSGELLADHLRLTALGRFLRNSSLDEMPQLWNVLKGDMSLIGPRPLLAEYLPRYSPRESRRHEMRPGITGWAQVNGRNNLDWPRKFDLDVWYVDHWNLRLDWHILLRTVSVALRRDGVDREQNVTMPKFTGV